MKSSQKALKSTFTSWLKILQAKEIGQIFFLSHEDCSYRAYQFRDWVLKQGQVVRVLDIDADLLGDGENLERVILEEKEPVIIVFRSFFLTSPDANIFFAKCEKIRVSRSLGILFLHEGLPSQIRRIDLHTSSLYQHEYIYPLYTEETISGFIDSIMRDWKISVKENQKKQIFSACGGNIWLVTDILRNLRDRKTPDVSAGLIAESFQKKMQLFWNSLPQEHRTYLTYGSRHGDEDAIIEKELTDYHFYLSDKDTFQLPWYLEQLILTERERAFTIKETQVQFHGDDITNHFSRGERRIFKYLYDHAQAAVGREVLGKVFWLEKASEEYSDWALDKIMSRLRKKIQSLNLPIVIATMRGKGYVYRRNQ